MARVKNSSIIAAGTAEREACGWSVKKAIFLLTIFISAFCMSSDAQTTICPPNIDFELGNYSNWLYYTGSCCPGGTIATSPVPITPPGTSFVLTSGTGVDVYGGFPVVGNGIYSLKLGSTIVNGHAQKATYYVHVPASPVSYSLIYRYAAVLENPMHSPIDQPRMIIQGTDSATGTNIPGSSLNIVAGSFPGFLGPVSGDVYYKPWTTQIVNLAGYNGSTIIMSFAVGDCGTGGHFGYGYIDMSCGFFPLSSVVRCDTPWAVLYAASGFASYAWYDSATFTISYGTTDSIWVPTPASAMHFALIETPAPGFGPPDTLYTTIYPPPTLPAITGTKTVCIGSTTVLHNATAGGTWSSGTTAVATVSGTGIVMGITAGTSVISYSKGGCTAQATVSVNAVSYIVSGNTNICEGKSVVLSSAAGGTWSSSNTAIATVSASGAVSGILAGTAIITYTTAACTVYTTSVVVNAVFAITGPANICTSGTATLTCMPPGGTWSSSNAGVATISSGGVITGIVTGTTVITYLSPGGCSSTKMISVTGTTPPITGVLQICTGRSATLSDAVTGGVWSSGATGIATVDAIMGVVIGVSAGTATVTYSLGGGCMTTTVVTVYQSPNAGTVTGPSDLCVGATLTLHNTASGGTWSSSNSTVTITSGGIVTGVSSGTVTIRYIVDNGSCADTADKVITVYAIPDAGTITGPPTLCEGMTITLNDTATGGVWSSVFPGIAAINTSGVVTGVSAGTDTIKYTVSNPGCIAAVTGKIITVYEAPDPGVITGPSNLCTGATITLHNTASGGTWSSSNTRAMITSGGIVTGVSTGTVTIRYTVSNGLCTDTATHIITIYPVPNAGAITGPSVLCQGMTIAMSDTASGGVWSSVSPRIATINTGGAVTGISGGVDTIKYTVSNPGCTAVVSKAITVYDVPDPGTVKGQAHVCTGAIVILSDPATGGVWGSSHTAVATIDSLTGHIHAVGNGTTVISYTTGSPTNGCIAVATFTLTVTQLATFTIKSTVTPIQCNGGNDGGISITISGGTPPFQYLWSNGNTTSAISGLTPGQYILNISEPATQCRAADSFHISEPDSLLVSAETTMDICKRGVGTISTKVTGGTTPYKYQWSDNSTGSGLENLHSGTYSVTVADTNGCTKTLSIQVEDNDCGDIIIHDVITPNGDGANDVWVIEGIQNYPANTAQVFDKWGDMVYEKTNYNNDWNGKGKGGVLPDGTYYYLVKLNMKNAAGGKDTFTGTVLIKR